MAKRVNDHRGDEWQEPGRMSFTDFSTLVRQNVTEIMQVREQVQRAYDIFSSQGNIGFDECNYLLASLRRMNTTVCTFHQLFEAPGKLPAVVSFLYYSLAAELCSIEKQVKRVMLLIGSLCSINRVALHTAVKQHYTIISILKELLEICQNVRVQSQALLDQARFQRPRSM
jgi:hypothetical protein